MEPRKTKDKAPCTQVFNGTTGNSSKQGIEADVEDASLRKIIRIASPWEKVHFEEKAKSHNSVSAGTVPNPSTNIRDMHFSGRHGRHPHECASVSTHHDHTNHVRFIDSHETNSLFIVIGDLVDF